MAAAKPLTITVLHQVMALLPTLILFLTMDRLMPNPPPQSMEQFMGMALLPPIIALLITKDHLLMAMAVLLHPTPDPLIILAGLLTLMPLHLATKILMVTVATLKRHLLISYQK